MASFSLLQELNWYLGQGNWLWKYPRFIGFLNGRLAGNALGLDFRARVGLGPVFGVPAKPAGIQQGEPVERQPRHSCL